MERFLIANRGTARSKFDERVRYTNHSKITRKSAGMRSEDFEPIDRQQNFLRESVFKNT